MTATTEVRVPDIGDFDEVPVIEILVSVGDTVAAEDPLVTLESEKATMDVPAPSSGVVREIAVQIGDRVSQGTQLLTLEAGDGGAPALPPSTAAASAAAAAQSQTTPAPAAAPSRTTPAAAPPAAAPVAVPSAAAPAAAPSPAPTIAVAPSAAEPASIVHAAGAGGAPAGGPIYASPSARRLARELGLDLRAVQGSGRGGRITRDDVQGLSARGARGAAAPAAGGPVLDLPPWPAVDFERHGPVERVPRSRIQRISAPNLARNWVMIPHVTHNDEADITELEAWRRRLNEEHGGAGAAGSGEAGSRPAGPRFTMVSFLVAASVATLKRFPEFNASLDGDELVLKRYWNIGFAADTPGGLVVPVIKNADAKGLREIAAELAELSGRAREGRLTPADISGSTFTISSLGGIGGTSFTPIVNAPEVAILGVTRAAMKPVWNGSEFEPRLMLPLSLSYDHRVIDGAAAARFTVHLAGVLSDLRRALL